MPKVKTLFQSSASLSIDKENENIVVQFPTDLVPTLCISTKHFSETDLEAIQKKKYCNGCKTLSIQGHIGKKDWCDFSKKITPLIINHPDFDRNLLTKVF